MDFNIIKKFLVFILPYRKQEILLFFLMVCGVGINLSTPLFLKTIIDDVIPSKDIGSLFMIIVWLFILYILRIGINFYSDYLSTWLGNKIVNDIKESLFRNLLEKPVSFFDKNKSGDIIQRINNETQKIQFFLSHSIIRLIGNIVTIIGLVVVLCIFNYKLFLVSIVMLPLSIFVNKFFSEKLKKVVKESSIEEGDLFSYFIDALKNIKLIKIFSSQVIEIKHTNSKLQKLLGLYVKSSIYSSIGRNGSSFFVALGTLTVLSYGGMQVMSGFMTVGTLVVFIQYLNRIYGPSNDLINLYVDCIRAQISMERVLPLLEVEKDKYANLFTEQISSITINNIKMNYDEKCVLENFSCEFHKGNTYALVGKSGSGKSTLIHALCKYYNPSSGKIFINEHHELEIINSKSWLKKIILVHQEPFVFDKSLRYNLMYGNPLSTEDELQWSLSQVLLKEHVESLPKKLDTIIGDGEGSIILSGGQKQQLCIARALLKNSEVVILDEATSAMDSRIEKKILDNIYKLVSNKILIVISHRLSSIKGADEIFLLKQGKIIENGNHHNLMNLKGEYFKLFENQIERINSYEYNHT